MHIQVVSQPTPARPHHLCDREMETAISSCELTGLTLGSNTSNIGASNVHLVCETCCMHQCSPVPVTCFDSVRHFQVLPWCRCFVIYRPKVFQGQYSLRTKHMCSICTCNCNTQTCTLLRMLHVLVCFFVFRDSVSIPCFDNVWSIRTDVIRKLSSVHS